MVVGMSACVSERKREELSESKPRAWMNGQPSFRSIRRIKSLYFLQFVIFLHKYVRRVLLLAIEYGTAGNLGHPEMFLKRGDPSGGLSTC